MVAVIHKAPYSRLDPVLNALKAIRAKTVPDKIDSTTLAKWGIAEGNAYQVTQTLRFLGLIDNESKPTEVLERLRRATPDEFPAVLGNILRTSYDFIFEFFDPAHDGASAISNAFYQVEPRGQRERMEWLFAGLCREAGILPKEEKPARVPQSKPRSGTTQSKRRGTARQSTEMATQRLDPATIQGSFFAPSTVSPYEAMLTPQVSAAREPRIDPRYDLLVSLIEKLPPSGMWTKAEHELWTQVWDGALKMCVRVTPENEQAD